MNVSLQLKSHSCVLQCWAWPKMFNWADIYLWENVLLASPLRIVPNFSLVFSVIQLRNEHFLDHQLIMKGFMTPKISLINRENNNSCLQKKTYFLLLLNEFLCLDVKWPKFKQLKFTCKTVTVGSKSITHTCNILLHYGIILSLN